jgi:hypothetical protein
MITRLKQDEKSITIRLQLKTDVRLCKQEHISRYYSYFDILVKVNKYFQIVKNNIIL